MMNRAGIPFSGWCLPQLLPKIEGVPPALGSIATRELLLWKRRVSIEEG